MRIARQVNSSTQSVYWNSRKLLSERQLEKGSGSGVVKQLSIDLKNEFPDIDLSPRNLWDMKPFFTSDTIRRIQNCDRPSQFCHRDIFAFD
ncbi:DUF1016 N-terminal domain-containing protein [Dyadobacter luticola]|uniref:DUF1016 N-terminal domain-containing protein n=1 Tax=Dyadobacter luticola TaxID=1979387 RepID=UPI00286E0818|nr:DUF1016 N-terminal domain-containing protein [Dyadobacter luticola]